MINLKRGEKSLESAKKKFKAKPMIVYLYSDVEPKYPSVRAIDFFENIEKIISVPTRKNKMK